MSADEERKRGSSVTSSPSQHPTSPSTVEPVIFYSRWCKDCGLCAAFCPKDAIEMSKDGGSPSVKAERCNSCGLCEVLCPDFAIDVPARHNKA